MSLVLSTGLEACPSALDIPWTALLSDLFPLPPNFCMCNWKVRRWRLFLFFSFLFKSMLLKIILKCSLKCFVTHLPSIPPVSQRNLWFGLLACVFCSVSSQTDRPNSAPKEQPPSLRLASFPMIQMPTQV